MLCLFLPECSLWGKKKGVDRFKNVNVHCILKGVPKKEKKATQYLIPVHKDNPNIKIIKPTFPLLKWDNNRIHEILSIINVA